MSKLVITLAASAVILGAGLAASSPAAAKAKHRTPVAVVEPQVLVPGMPLIGGPPVRQGAMCMTIKSADWGAGYAVPCAK